MKHLYNIWFLILVFTSIAMAQESPDKQRQIEAMLKLNFLTGEWSGKGWIIMGPDHKEFFSQKESVYFKTDGITLLIEGNGYDLENEDEITHDALALVYFDSRTDSYKFNSHVMQGYHGSYQAEIKQDTFIWKMENPYAGLIRYTISLNDKGQWYEVGERKTQEGQMVKFFEMTLNKKTNN